MVAGALLAGAGLVGCDGANADPEPEPDPEPPTTEPEEPETPDSEETDAEPEEGPGPQDYPHPEPGTEIEDDSQAGAEAAAVYFVELFSYVAATGDLEAWEDLSAPDCEFCQVAQQRVEETYNAGGWVETGPPVIEGVTSDVWASDPGDYVAEVVVRTAGSRHYASGGELSETFAATTVTTWVLVANGDEGWQVLGAEAEDSD